MKWIRFACVAAALALVACGGSPVARPTPTPGESPAPNGSPAASASPSSSPQPAPVLMAGAPAWIAVSVADGWRSPSSPRPVDAPALENPARVRAWLDGMSAADQYGLIDRLDTQALLGEEVVVLQLSGEWAKVAIPDQPSPLDSRGYPVWIPVRQLTPVAPPDSDWSVTVTAPTAMLRSGGGTLEVSFGTTLPLLGQQDAEYRVGLPGRALMTVAEADVTLGTPKANPASIVAAARRLLGLPYLWGGTSGFGLDCTGLTHLVYRAYGIVIPRDSDPQSKFGTAVARPELQPGDLVFFSSGGVAYHAVLYAGDGMIINSYSFGYPVQEVALASFPDLPYYSGARRVTTPPPAPSPPSGLPASLAGGECLGPAQGHRGGPASWLSLRPGFGLRLLTSA